MLLVVNRIYEQDEALQIETMRAIMECFFRQSINQMAKILKKSVLIKSVYAIVSEKYQKNGK